MPTTVTKSIGTSSRDYSTVQAWEDALPANLVTGDTVQIGECYNDSEFTSASTLCTFSGSTTDSTHTITLKCASGQSFRDNANVQTNGLRYNQSNGVGIRCTNEFTQCFVISEDYVILQGLQISGSNSASDASNFALDLNSTSYTNVIIENCILEARNSSSFNGAVRLRSGTIRNCLIVNRNSGAGNGITFSFPGTVSALNCTIVRPSDLTAAGSAVYAESSTATVTNCALFGFTNSANNTSYFAGSNNCSNATIGFGSSNQASKTYANQFQTTTDTSRDFRIKTGADCVDNGTTDTSASPDIAGTTRPSSSAYDIGCWELVVSAGGTALKDLIGMGIIPWSR